VTAYLLPANLVRRHVHATDRAGLPCGGALLMRRPRHIELLSDRPPALDLERLDLAPFTLVPDERKWDLAANDPSSEVVVARSGRGGGPH
jgi:hypothetical protein